MYSLSLRDSVKSLFEKLHRNLATGDIPVVQLQHIREKWDSHVIKILLSLSLDQQSFAKFLSDMENRVIIFNFYLHLFRHFADTFSEKMQGKFY